MVALSPGHPARKVGPGDAQYSLNSIDYKVGRHGMVFRWDGSEWVRSTLTVKEIERGTMLQMLETRQEQRPVRKKARRAGRAS